MKHVLIFMLGLLTVACTSEKEEVKDLSDILPESERDYDQKDTVEVDNSDSLKIYQAQFTVLGSLDSIAAYDEDLFPDRFGPENMEKFQLFFEGEEVVFVKWIFSDSARVSNALFNWADCFGPKCNSIRIGEEKNLQRNAFQVLANDTSLIYIESSNNFDSRKLDTYFDEQGYELDWNYRLEQSRSGRVRWYNYLDKKKTPIKNDAL